MARPKVFDDESVLDVAMLCFWRRGYTATSIKDLQAATGLTPGSLYNSFGSKDGLFLRVLDHYVDRIVRRRVQRYLQRGDVPRGIEDFIGNCFDPSSPDPPMACLIVNTATELGPHDKAIAHKVQRALTYVERGFYKALQRGQGDGSISASADAGDLARHLALLMNGMLVASKVKTAMDKNWLTNNMAPVKALLQRSAG